MTAQAPAAEPEEMSPPMAVPSRARAVVGAAAGLAAGMGMIGLSLTIEISAVEAGFSPRWWAQAAGGAMALFCLAALLRDGARPETAAEEMPARQPGGERRILLTLTAVLLYGVLWHFLDFRVVTVLLVAALAAIGGGRGWKALVLFPAVVTAVLWTLFGVLLRVPV